MKGGIYKILNLITGLFYIGSTGNFNRRFIEHKKLLRHSNHKNSYLQNTWNKHSELNFKFEILEIIESPTKELLADREQYWINLTECYKRHIGYNIRPKAENNLGVKFSDDFRKKRVIIQTGKRPSLETRARMSNSHKNRIRSPDIGIKISKAKKGKGLGKVTPEETKIKMRKAQKERRDKELIPSIVNILDYEFK